MDEVIKQKKEIKVKKQREAVNSSGGEEIASLKKNNIDKFDELESYKNLRSKRKKRAWIRAVVWLLVILVSPIIVFFSLVIVNPTTGANFFGYTFYIVESESMRPVFDINDCIVVKHLKSKDEVQIGTDICFVRKSDGKIVTHRVIDITENEMGEIEYITRGVHNPVADDGSVAFENIVGKRVAVLSVLGHVVMFFRTWVGILVFLLIFVLIIFGFVLSFKYSNDIRAIGN